MTCDFIFQGKKQKGFHSPRIIINTWFSNIYGILIDKDRFSQTHQDNDPGMREPIRNRYDIERESCLLAIMKCL